LNILIIMADQHRYDCLGAYGNKDIRTPHIDALAEDGVVFDNSFCASPVCTPSRYSFITGLYPHQHLGWGNRSTIPAGLATFPKLLREAGYLTKAVGKMHYTPTYLDVGFGEMELAEQNGDGRYDDDYHAYLMRRGEADCIDLIDQVKKYRKRASEHYWDSFGAMESNLPEELHSTTWIGERGLEALDRWEGDRNLLMVSFIKPHHPFDPPAPWSRMYDPQRLTLLPGWTESCLPHDLQCSKGYFGHERLTEPALRQAMALYYGSISQIDHYVGKMVEKLKQKGLYDDTLILYTSDHGEYMGFHHLLLKGNYMYDPLAKVPLVIKYPGNRHKGTRRSDLVSNVDIAPTLLALAGCSGGEAMAGKDLSQGPTGREFVFAEIGRGTQYMLRSETRKLILHKDRSLSLYIDLEKDPLELHNLFFEAEYREEVRRMSETLYSFVLFESVSPNHVDAEANVIDDPARTGKDASAVMRYFDERMDDYLRN